MATEMTVEAVVTNQKSRAEGGAAAAAPSMRGSHNETANNDTMVANGDVQSTQNKEEIIFEDPPLVKTDRFGFTGGKQYEDEDVNVPLEVIRRREIKWLDMLDDWEKWMTKKPKKVRERCRKGIPPSIRSRAWQYLCGSKKLMEQNKQRWKEFDEMEGEHKWVEIIRKDLNRQFPFHEMFSKRGGHGQQDLFRMLKAYSIYNPRDGYCQGQAPVAAVLLMHMPLEEAFWCFVQVCDKYLTGYYSPGLEAVQIDGQVLQGLLNKVLPATSKHMNKHKVEPILYVTEWFMCVYARTLPWRSVLRVWDMFLCEGVKVIFRVALVLLKDTLGRPDQMAEAEGLYEIMERLKNLPPQMMDDEFIYQEMVKLNVYEKDMEAEHSLQVARRQVIKQRQKDREGQSNIMSRNIEAIQQRQKSEKKSKVKADDSPRKAPSKKSVDSPVKSKTNGQEVAPPTIISVKPLNTSVVVGDTSNMQDKNGAPDNTLPQQQGENGTPRHRVPPPLPPGVVLEAEPEKKAGQDKKKSKKVEKKEEKEKEKTKLKELKQKEKEERQKHKAQFKTNKEKEKAEKAAAKEKEKAEKAKEKEKKSHKDKKGKQKVGSVEPTSPGPQESAPIQVGGTFQTLEVQKKEYMHLTDPKDPVVDSKGGNGHAVQSEVNTEGEDVTVSETETMKVEEVKDKEEKTLDIAGDVPDIARETTDVTGDAEEVALPGVRRIEVQEAAESSDKVDKRKSNIPTETDIDAVEADVDVSGTDVDGAGTDVDAVQSVDKLDSVKPVENGVQDELNNENKLEDVLHKNEVPKQEVLNVTSEDGDAGKEMETSIDVAEYDIVEELDNETPPKGVTSL